MIDSHAHVEMCDDDAATIVERATSVGVDRILTIGLTGATFDETLAIADAHEQVFAAVGWHPNETSGYGDAEAAQIAEAAKHPKVRAIGETGLDFYREYAPHADQRRAFISQIEIATDFVLPVSIHARAAEAECIELLLEYGDDLPAVVLHCFGDPSVLDAAIEAGFHCSFAGNVTFKNAADLREAAARVPDHLLLVETDAPFLAPQPVRGKRCEPAYVKMTAEAIAEARGITYEQLDSIVSANAARIFRW